MVLCFSSLAAGFNATAPGSDDQPVGWQAGGDDRGTWTIISSCLSTIFACTWSVQHLNLPGKASSDGQWARKLRSCKWMLINIFFPEFIVLQAAFELIMAMQALNLMADHEKAVVYPWWYHRHPSLSTLVQQFSDLWRRCRGMLSCSPRHNGRDTEAQKAEEVRKWTLTHCFFANMGGFYYEHKKSRFPLTALQIAVHKDGFDYPEQSEEEILDKSKTDWFAKGVAALQFSQLALSLMVRTNQGLNFSQLEAVTLGFAICGFTVYLIYLYKPQNVETPFIVEQNMETLSVVEQNAETPSVVENGVGTPTVVKQDVETPSAMKIGVTETSPIRYERTFESFWEILTNKKIDTGNIEVVDRIPNDNIPIVRNSSVHPGVFLLALASGLFGALHAIAWNFEFPTAVERILWRTATVVAAGSPMVGLITIPLAQLTVSFGDPRVFMADCLRLLREFTWHNPDKVEIDRVYNQLEQIYIKPKTDDDAKLFYKFIFSHPNNQPPQLGKQLLKFIESSEELRETLLVNLHPDFIKQFRSLCDLMEEKDAKKLCETARTNVFPRKNLLPKAFNLSILLVTSTLYCLSRLSLLAVTLSSLRLMPKSVYLNTPWTKYIPSLGSMS